MQLILKVESGPFRLSELQSTRVWIGACQAARLGRNVGELTIPKDTELSKEHFEITCDGTTCRIRNLDSNNVTFLNGKRVQQAKLHHGDKVQAGQTVLRVTITGAPTRSADTELELIPFGDLLAEASTPKKPDPLRMFNATPFSLALMPGQCNYPQHSVTVIVKGTFDMQNGKVVAPAKEQLPIEGDVPYPDDEAGTGAPRYSSDMVPFKSQGDLLLVGHCHAPPGQPTRRMDASFQVGSRSHSITVRGDQQWEGFMKSGISEPQPFEKVELRYEKAYGGPEYAKNPIGVGFKTEATQVPNLLRPSESLKVTQQQFDPAGFGPLSAEWPQRKSHLGTYDLNWAKTRWPWFAEDFNWQYFNAAPPEMRVPGYLRGDEQIKLKNLHADHLDFLTQLPGWQIRCFLNEETGGPGSECQFRELAMNLDTLWVDTDASQLVLVWRGVANVREEDFPEIRHVFTMAEALHAQQSVEKCLDVFRKVLANWEAQWEGKPKRPKPFVNRPMQPAEAKEPAEERLSPEDEQIRAHQQKQEADMRARLAAAGIDPQNPPELTPEEKDLLRAQGIEVDEDDEPEGPIPPDPWTREAVQQWHADENSFEDQDLSGLDLSGIDLQGANFTRAKLIGTNFAKANLSGTRLADADLTESNLSAAVLEKTDFTAAALTKTDLSQASAKEADFSSADLTEAKLVGGEFPKALFVSANLMGAQLQQAALVEADVSKANAQQADLSNSQLSQADFTGADLAKCKLNGADASSTDFSQAKLESANLAGIQATKAIFTAADLTDAVANDGVFEKAEFGKSQLHRTSFLRANLQVAALERALGLGVDFTEANLTGAKCGSGCDFTNGRFKDIQACGSTWTDATLNGCDFSFAVGHDSNFCQARLEGANFYGADLKQSRMAKADLRKANLRSMNLFEGSLEKSDLTEADLREANLFRCEMHQAVLKKTNLDGANIKQTKLAMV